jgi:hypothetical protein
MRNWQRGRLFAALAIVILLLSVATCLADGGDPPVNPGDPGSNVPRCTASSTTPGILSDFWMILMAMAFQFAV